MPMDATIRQKVDEVIKREDMFTSMDISNAIKRDGIWVRNRETRDWLRANFTDKTIFGDYAASPIKVAGGAVDATLYHPLWKDPSTYTGGDQVPLTPDEVKEIAKNKVGQPNASAAPDISQVLSDTMARADLCFVVQSTERLKIPGEIIRRLGWSVGDVIDPARIKTSKVLPPNLKVNKDHRVSIPREAVDWGTSPVKVMLKNGEVVFDKA